MKGSRGEASRLGHSGSGLYVKAQSWQGQVTVHLFAEGEDDWLSLSVGPHGGNGPTLYYGKVSELCTSDGRQLFQEALARKVLEEQSNKN